MTHPLQSEWDRLIIQNFWPDFSDHRRRMTFQVLLSFEMVHGEVDAAMLRLPPLFMMKKRLSRFVCSQLPALADRLIDAEDKVDVEATARWLLDSRLQCTGRVRTTDRRDLRELREASSSYCSQRYTAYAWKQVFLSDTKLGGSSKSACRRKMAR